VQVVFMRWYHESTNMADHDADFGAYGEDPWQTVRRALNVVSLDAVGGDVEDPNARKVLACLACQPRIHDG
jgi:hypothetical protein